MEKFNDKRNSSIGNGIGFKNRKRVLFGSITNCLEEPNVNEKQILIRASVTLKPRLHNKNLKVKKSILNELINYHYVSQSSIMSEMKCFMTMTDLHDSYLISRKLISECKKKLAKVNNEI